MFLKLFARFKDGRYGLGDTGIVGIKFKHEEGPASYFQGEVRIVFGGHFFLTFAHERLALVFQADFDEYMGGDLQTCKSGACTRVKLADSEMSKPPSHVRARRGLDRGACRYDGDVWQWCEPSTDRSKHFNPQCAEVDAQMEKYDVHYQDEYIKRWGARRRQ